LEDYNIYKSNIPILSDINVVISFSNILMKLLVKEMFFLEPYGHDFCGRVIYLQSAMH